MKKAILLFSAWWLVVAAMAQRHDNHWVFSYALSSDNRPDGSVMSFTGDSLHIAGFDPAAITIQNQFPTVSDAAGNLLFYTNGLRIINAAHQPMENGDSLNWLPNAATWPPFPIIAQEWQGLSYPAIYSAVAIPEPGQASSYLLFHLKIEYDTGVGVRGSQLLLTKVDMSANNGTGRVMVKNRVILEDFNFMAPALCRHGNGRDWWLAVNRFETNLYHTLLIRPDTILYQGAQQVGLVPPAGTVYSGGEKLFSPDGSRYASFDSWAGLQVLDFDRCSGQFSNPRGVFFDSIQSYGGGAAFSPNSRFLYFTTSRKILQADLNAASLGWDTVAIWEPFYSPSPPFAVTFGPIGLMPDGRLYCIPFISGVYHIHVVAKPDEPGTACMVMQHAVEAPGIVSNALPRYVNYRLYDLPGSTCDTLGIDGPAVAALEPLPSPNPQPRARLAPNPAVDDFHLFIPDGHPRPVYVELWYPDGRLLTQWRYIDPQGAGPWSARLPAGLACGMYWVRIVSEAGQMEVLPLVKW